MKYQLFRRSILISCICIAVLFIASCSTSKRVTYFTDISDSLNTTVVKDHYPFKEPIIHADDQLAITVSTIEAKSASSSEGGSSAQGASVYLVDKNGNIDMPIVGRVQVAGHTTAQVKDIVYEKAKKYYVEPIVNVRFAYFNITVLGDVLRPGTLIAQHEKVSILDAIGLAGDISVTGRRDNILLIRETGDKKEFVRLDANSSTLVQSPYFYLQPGDIIVVEPVKSKSDAATRDASKERYIPYIFSSVTILIALTTLYIQLNR
jgi:polysaccharide biosynthesis/export protein